MAFFNGQRKSKLFVVPLLIISMIATYSMAMSVYAEEDLAEPRNPTTTEEVSTVDLSLEPTDDNATPVSDSTNYTVEYKTTDGEEFLPDKVVEDQSIGTEVTEQAVRVQGYSVDESSKSLILEEDDNKITFVYTQAETEEEEIPPVQEETLPEAEEEETPPVEEEILPAVEPLETEVVTEPAIVLEPTEVTLTITHRLVVGDQSLDDVQIVGGLEIGQIIDLAPYILTEDWFGIASDVTNITLNEQQTSIVLEYKPVEGFVVVVPDEIPDDISDM